VIAPTRNQRSTSPSQGTAAGFRRVGRYALFDEVGHGGTASVHMGRLVGPAGFAKTVAIKRMHENVGRDGEVAAMFLDEARISGRIRHPNVVGASDLLSIDGEIFLVMDYVHGETLASLLELLLAQDERISPVFAVHVMRDVLSGLHAAHEALDESGQPLGLVHRDVSPQNVLVGVDGVARVLDFGVAKALGRLQDTHTGQVKGKLAYMAPEQILGQVIDRRVDVFAAGVVLWEALAGRRLFKADNPGQTVQRVLNEDVPRLVDIAPGVSQALSDAVARAIDRNVGLRFPSAVAFAHALEQTTELVSPRVVGEWLQGVAGEDLARRTRRLQEIESTPIEVLLSEAPSGSIRNGVEESQATRLEGVPGASMDDRTATDFASPARARRPREVVAPSEAALVREPRVEPPPAQKNRRLGIVVGTGVALAAGIVVAVLGVRSEAVASESAAQTVASSVTPSPVVAQSSEALRAPPAAPVTKEEARREVAPAVAATAVASKPRRTTPARPTKASPKPAKQAPLRAEDLFSRN
jgi:serine/threonine-protein kinase